MAANIVYQFAYKRVSAVNRVVEKWKADHVEAQAVMDVDQQVAEVTGLLDSVRRLANLYWDGIQPNSPDDDKESAHHVGGLMHIVLAAFDIVRARVNLYVAKGFVIDNAKALDRANEDLRSLYADFAKKWLLPTKDTVESALKAVKAGKCRVL